jgi:Domain of unknown function (DUF4261)
MARGLFSQSVCLLTDGRTAIEDVKSVLQAHGFEIVREVPPPKDPVFGGPGLSISFLPAVNGLVAVDVVNQPWPDAMGDPKADAMTFGGWTLGFFGPFTYPGGLARAQKNVFAWEGAGTVCEGYRGFIRLRLSYVFGSDRSAPTLPEHYNPVAELMFLSRMALAILNARGVICYFNPNGEVLRDRASFRKFWDRCTRQSKIPLPLWTNVRFFHFDNEMHDEMLFMDTVGNAQLDVRDIEAVFPAAKCRAADVGYHLLNFTHYLLDLGRDLRTGESVDGPYDKEGSWCIEALDPGFATPPRRVLRIYPKDAREMVYKALTDIGVARA